MLTSEKHTSPAALVDESTILSAMFAPHASCQDATPLTSMADIHPGAPYNRDHCSGYDEEAGIHDRSRLLYIQPAFESSYNSYRSISHGNLPATDSNMPKMWDTVKNVFGMSLW